MTEDEAMIKCMAEAKECINEIKGFLIELELNLDSDNPNKKKKSAALVFFLTHFIQNHLEECTAMSMNEFKKQINEIQKNVH